MNEPVAVIDNTASAVSSKSPTALKESLNISPHSVDNEVQSTEKNSMGQEVIKANPSQNESIAHKNIKPKKKLLKRKAEEKVSISWNNHRGLMKPFPSSHSPLLAKPIGLLLLLLVPSLLYYSFGRESYQIRGIFFLVTTALCWRYFLKLSNNKVATDTTQGSDWGQEYLKGRVTMNFSLPVDAISKYLEEKKFRDDVNITHLVVRAVGLALKETPGLNGHHIFGTFYPAKTIDVSCEVRVKDGTSALLKVFEADKKSIDDIYYVMTKKTQALQQGQDIFLTRRNAILHSLPVQFIPGLVDFLDTMFTFISCSLGISIPYLGIKAFPQGVCTVIPPKPYVDRKSTKNEAEVVVERDIDQERKSNSSRSSMILTIGGLELRPKMQNNSSVPYLLAYLNFSLVVYLSGGGSVLSVRKFSDKLQELLINPVLMEETKKEKQV